MKQKVFRLVILFSLLSVLAGSPVLAQGVEPPLPPTGVVTLWHAYSPGGGEETALLQVIAAAEAAYPGLDIVPEFHSFDTIYTDYETAVLAGGGPDMYIVPNDPLGDEVRMGVILNIDSYLTGRLANVDQTAIDSMKVNGLMYGVPESAKAVALYYNKSLVPTPPATTAELLSLVQGGQTFGGAWIGYFMYGFFPAFGGQLMDAKGYCIADKGGYVPALQYMLDLQAAGADIHFIDEGTLRDAFLVGGLGMYVGGPWYLKEVEESPLGQSGNVGVSVLPAGPSGPARPFTGTDGFFINPNTTNPANVVETALYMTNQASSQIFMDLGGHVPVRSDVTTTDPLISAFAQAAIQGEPRPQNAQFGAYWSAFAPTWENVMGGVVTPLVGVRSGCKAMNYQNGFSLSDTLTSVAIQDGWVLESSEFSNIGGTMNSTATTFVLGDDALDRQYRAILSFNTAGLPDDAVITKMTIKIKQAGPPVGTNPFVTHGNIQVDIRKSAFSGNAALQTTDFQAPPSKPAAGTIKNLTSGGWHLTNLVNTAIPSVNKLGITQFRLRFAWDDNDDRGADYLKFFSGNAPLASRPVLIVTYHKP